MYIFVLETLSIPFIIHEKSADFKSFKTTQEQIVRFRFHLLVLNKLRTYLEYCKRLSLLTIHFPGKALCE